MSYNFLMQQLQVHITKEYLQLEPIGLVFVFFFALILIIQFTAMLFHRFGTISHILASTELNLTCSKKAEELSQDALIDKVGYLNFDYFQYSQILFFLSIACGRDCQEPSTSPRY